MSSSVNKVLTNGILKGSSPASLTPSHIIIHNAHNGHTIKVPKPLRFHTISAFKVFLYESFTSHLIGGTENIFLLTSFGIKFNFNMVNELNELYVFDKRLFSSQNKEQSMEIVEQYLSQNLSPINNRQIIPHPTQITLSANFSVKNMSEVLQKSAIWSKGNLEIVKLVELEIKAISKQINTIFRCFNIIFLFGTNFINEIEKSFQSYYNYIKLTNMKTLHNNWKHYYQNLQNNFPTFKLIGKPEENSSKEISLHGMFKINKLELSADYVGKNLPKVVECFNEMSKTINSVNEDKVSIDSIIKNLRNDSISKFKEIESQVGGSFREIERLTREFLDDLEEMTNTSSGIKSLETLYRSSGYSNSNIYEHSKSLWNTLAELKNFRKRTSEKSFQIFNGIANLQLRMVNLKDELRDLTGGSKSKTPSFSNIEEKIDKTISFETIGTIKKMEDYLSLTIDLPLLFGFMLIEKRRQYEWYDFYSKGVVKNISEQLSTMIDHEKVFRKLWIKKFGGFLSSLNDRDDYLSNPKLPSIDVTLVNGGMEYDEFGKILKGILIQRKDVIDYIEILKKYLSASVNTSPSSKNFVHILEKNFQDLVKSTNSMKRVTKVVSSISTLTLPHSDELGNEKLDNQMLAMSQIGKNLSIENGYSHLTENDSELDIINGLKSRINKLENLLHQQQYKNLAQWPVTRKQSTSEFNPDSENGKYSLIVDRKQLQPVFSQSQSKTNPTVFLSNSPRTPTSPHASISRVTSGEILDASTTIDKHLDNIRLRKENSELTIANKELSAQNSENERVIRQLKEEVFKMKEDQKILNDKLNTIINISQEKDQQISTLQVEMSKYMGMNNEKFEENTKLNQLINLTKEALKDVEIKNEILQGQLSDTTTMKNDLLSNMTAKESDFSKERNILEEEIKALKGKVEEVIDDYEDLMELTQTKQNGNGQIIKELNFIGNELLDKLKSVLLLSFNFYYDFCLVLESMGLLLVKEFNPETKLEEFNIVRVKGLRSKREKSGNNFVEDHDHDEPEQDSPQIPSTKIIEDLSTMIQWARDLEIVPMTPPDMIESKDLSEVVNVSRDISIQEQSTNNLLEVFKENFKNDSTTGEVSKFENIFKSLKNPLPKHDVTDTSHTAFVAAISKRFRDVEGFAKKLTKENRSKGHEITKLGKKLNGKISMNNFQVNDLVLFLPTKIDHMSEFQESFQPWAAFNFGAPHYFLRVREANGDGEGKLLHDLKQKEWMVGRIVEIVSNTATDDNNPFQLTTGVSWYYVEATEVEF